jgi:putative transposase
METASTCRTQDTWRASCGNCASWKARNPVVRRDRTIDTKTRRKIAVVHGAISRARRDSHHKQALALIRDNQVIHVEDLNIVGVVRNRRLARAISDAGSAQFVRIIGEKAEKYGRTMHSVSRWLASSKTCSACGSLLDELSLQVRVWRCPACAMHDRDHNAAKVILAAGRAERRNVCGASVSPSTSRKARGDEAGSRKQQRSWRLHVNT